MLLYLILRWLAPTVLTAILPVMAQWKESRAIEKPVHCAKPQPGHKGRNLSNHTSGLIGACGIFVGLVLLLCGSALPSMAKLQPHAASTVADAARTQSPAEEAALDQQSPGTISGTVEDQSGAIAVGAQVHLTRQGQSSGQDALTGVNGQFSFSHIPPGPFHLNITATGFKPQEVSGVLHPGEFYIVPQITLTIAAAETEVKVGLSPEEIALQEVKIEEKQRIWAIIPNFYVTYSPDAAPLTSKLKFELAWKSVTDPFTFTAVGALAGLEQASDDFSGYGEGMQGYAKRYGASYADIFAGTFIGSAILPSLLKQDPRYFYKGTGSTRSRLLYALANSVICKGDNKRWQPNYSNVVGSFAVGGFSYLYYPATDRNVNLIVIQNALLRIAESSFAGVFQEFVVHKISRQPRTAAAPQP